LRQALFDREAVVERHRRGEAVQQRRDRLFQDVGEMECLLSRVENEVVFDAGDRVAVEFRGDTRTILGDEGNPKRYWRRRLGRLARRWRDVLRNRERVGARFRIILAPRLHRWRAGLLVPAHEL